jgi:hypothetical protein
MCVGMLFSLMLWAPSWAGMLNGLLTLRGAWDRIAKEPVLKFFAAAVTFYGMATFEGPRLSIRAVNALALLGLDHRPRPLRSPGLEGIHGCGKVLLARSTALAYQTLVKFIGEHAFLDRPHRHPPLCRFDVVGRDHAGPDVG